MKQTSFFELSEQITKNYGPVISNLLWKQTIFGNPVSKSNSRIISHRYVNKKLVPFFVKSKSAQDYQKDFYYQVSIRPNLQCDLILICKIYYQSRRNDLDESLIMDCLQYSRVIANDRQIKEKHIYGFVDKLNPRCEIELCSL